MSWVIVAKFCNLLFLFIFGQFFQKNSEFVINCSIFKKKSHNGERWLPNWFVSCKDGTFIFRLVSSIDQIRKYLALNVMKLCSIVHDHDHVTRTHHMFGNVDTCFFMLELMWLPSVPQCKRCGKKI